MSDTNKKNFLKFVKSGSYTDKYGKRTNVDKAVKGVKKIDLDLSTMKPASNRKMNTGGLTGNQKKIDKNKNNRIDAEDFKILKAEKKMGKPKGMFLGALAIGAIGAKKFLGKKKSATAMPGAQIIGKKGSGMGSMAASLVEKKKAELMGKRSGGVMKANKGRLAGSDFSERMKNVEKGLIDKKTGKPTSMAAMRELKGFKPGELPKEFNARRKALAGAKSALKATRIGKIMLGVAGAGLAAKAYLNKKLKESQEKKKNKKMGGGLAAATERLKAQGKMGGGMMMMPGYKKGKSVMAKGCKLGRKKPTKMY